MFCRQLSHGGCWTILKDQLIILTVNGGPNAFKPGNWKQRWCPMIGSILKNCERQNAIGASNTKRHVHHTFHNCCTTNSTSTWKRSLLRLPNWSKASTVELSLQLSKSNISYDALFGCCVNQCLMATALHCMKNHQPVNWVARSIWWSANRMHENLRARGSHQKLFPW